MVPGPIRERLSHLSLTIKDNSSRMQACAIYSLRTRSFDDSLYNLACIILPFYCHLDDVAV